MQNTPAHDLKIAERGAWISIAAYIIISIAQLSVASAVHSDALRANGFNNVTDILANIAIIIGLRMARIPADHDHVYGHWKVESIASLVTSFIMALIGFQILLEAVNSILQHEQPAVDPLGAWIGIFSAAIMLLVYLYNSRLARLVKSSALKAASKDNLSDAVTSIGTSAAILAASFHWQLVDKLMALLIAGFILKTAYDIFRDSAFSLSDGFDDSLITQYQAEIEKVDKVKAVKSIRGRTYGSNIFLDVVIEMSPDLSVFESHATTETIEQLLRKQFDVYDTDVHVEPTMLPDEEKEAALALSLLAYEERVSNGETDLLDERFFEVQADGQVEKTPLKTSSGFSKFQAQRVSAKTFVLHYETDKLQVTSIWRRNEKWLCLFRQFSGK